MLQKVLMVLQAVSAIFLVISIVVQERGGGLSDSIAGSAGANTIQTSKRGAEKVLSYLTIVFLVSFILLSLVLNFV
jgi:protein translocase SecG subunit